MYVIDGIDVIHYIEYSYSKTEQYTFQYVDLSRFNTIMNLVRYFPNPYAYIRTLKLLTKIIRFNVNPNMDYKEIISRYLAPISFYVHLYEFDLSKVHRINLIILNKSATH